MLAKAMPLSPYYFILLDASFQRASI